MSEVATPLEPYRPLSDAETAQLVELLRRITRGQVFVVPQNPDHIGEVGVSLFRLARDTQAVWMDRYEVLRQREGMRRGCKQNAMLQKLADHEKRWAEEDAADNWNQGASAMVNERPA